MKKRFPRKAKKWAKKQYGVTLISVRGKHIWYSHQYSPPFRIGGERHG